MFFCVLSVYFLKCPRCYYILPATVIHNIQTERFHLSDRFLSQLRFSVTTKQEVVAVILTWQIHNLHQFQVFKTLGPESPRKNSRRVMFLSIQAVILYVLNFSQGKNDEITQSSSDHAGFRGVGTAAILFWVLESTQSSLEESHSLPAVCYVVKLTAL